MDSKLNAALHNPIKQAKLFKTPEYSLARLFWGLVNELNVGERLWKRYMDRYVKDPRFVVQTAKRRNRTPGNLNTAILSEVRPMSWKTLINAWRLLGFSKVHIQFTLFKPGESTGIVNSMTLSISGKNTKPDNEKD